MGSEQLTALVAPLAAFDVARADGRHGTSKRMARVYGPERLGWTEATCCVMLFGLGEGSSLGTLVFRDGDRKGSFLRIGSSCQQHFT